MDVDPPVPRPSGAMTLPQGVVANAPYTQAPAPPMIVVPIGLGVLVDSRSTTPVPEQQQQQPEQRQETPTETQTALPTAAERMAAAAAMNQSELCWLKIDSLTIQPSMLNAGFMGLSAKQLQQFTGNRVHSICGDMANWSYKMRREAHAILDFLYLGPSAAARDRAFLQQEGITMLLAARDSRMAQARLLSVDRLAAELGLAAHHVDVFEDRRLELIQALPGVVHAINAHMLGGPNRKVLVFCETGNERSAAIVAAYIMTLYAINLIQAMQFVSARRFCVNFDDETKQMLKAYGDILQAQRDVDGTGGSSDSKSPAPETIHGSSGRRKRRIAETMDVEDDRDETSGGQGTSGQLQLDMARYEDRKAFVPFRDLDTSCFK